MGSFTKNIIEIKNLNFSWKDNHVLENINVSIPENQLIAILGINGAGKSTLLKCINKILKPDSGNIKIHSNNILDINLVELAKKISYVPQSVLTSFPMEVFDVVLLGRRPHISWRINNKDREKVSNTLKFLNLEDFAFRRFNQLSGGERQRVIIAKAIAQEPNLFLMDEPTSDLDLKNQIDVMSSVKKLVSKEKGSKSALIAIHDINTAARFADRILLLHNKNIIADGAPEEVLTEENIATVFGVTSQIISKSKSTPLRIIVKEKINEGDIEEE
tara:strand:- start:10202 stop:11023 length:822 start_codon:yes stop_codon:yes gene_type:complete